jgi:hypothetical protein
VDPISRIWSKSILDNIMLSSYPLFFVSGLKGISKHKKRRAVRHPGKSLEAPNGGESHPPGKREGDTISFNGWKPKAC